MCVVGAGAAGLAAAHALVRHGYRSVTVLERDSRVGGKCWTILHDGHTYEVGAGGLTTAYHNVRDLMREHRVRARPKVSGWFAEQGSERVNFLQPLLRSTSALSIMPEVVRIRRALQRHKRLLEPGIDGVDAELYQPFADWARKERVERVAELVRPWVTGFGYGFFDETPAVYVLKYLTVFRMPMYELLDTGYGGLWERVAHRLDARTGTEVRRVIRDGERVVVETDAGSREYDALIVACPLDDALAFIEASPSERELIERICYCSYHAVGAIVRNFPRSRYTFWEEHLKREALGEPMFAYRRWPESDLVFFYAFGTPDDRERIEAGVRHVVRRHGGSVERIELSRPWRYFPHVSSADLGAGFQERLEALQGHQRTFYTGEIFSFSMVEAVVAHARKIVDRHFAPPGGRPVLCGTRAHGGQALVQLRPSVQLRPRPSSSPPCVLRRARAPQPCPSRSVRTGTTQNGVRFELTSIRPGPGRAPRRGARARGLQRGCFRELHARAMAQRHGVARAVGQLMIRSRRFAPGGAPGEHSIDLLAGTRVRR